MVPKILVISSYCKHENKLIIMTKFFIIFIFDTIGTTKLKNFENNIGSLAVKLTDEDLREISDAVPIYEVAGKREFDSLSKYTWQFATTPSK